MSVLINTINIANAKEFIWISGSNETDQVGIFGEKGIPNPDNVPGARSSAAACIDSSNNLYLFGGDFEGGLRNDLWKYDGTNWTWISGSNITNQNGIYGDKGIPNADNVPGARSRAFSWTDSSDNFYLFGGYGYPEEDNFGYLNDLWKFDGTNWTWISGSKIRYPDGIYLTKGTLNEANHPSGREDFATWIDSSDNLYLFGGFGRHSGSNGRFNDLWKFDGTYWIWISGSNVTNQPGIYGEKNNANEANVPGARNGPFSWIDSSDNLYLFGGYGYTEDGSFGFLNDLWKFDGTYWTWISGSNEIVQHGIYGIKGIPNAENIPGSRGFGGSWIDSSNNLYLFGGYGFDGNDTSDIGLLNDLWKFDGTYWTWISGSNVSYQTGIYGEKGVVNPNNVPGARYRVTSWTDSSDNFYLFGGTEIIQSYETGRFNDLWVFTHVCFGIYSTSPQVCSGRGKCIDENVCQCTGAIGTQCEIPLCFGIPGNLSSVCSGHGTCKSTDSCDCDVEWAGDDCSIPSCHGKFATDPEVCSGKGICIDKNVCDCNLGWTGIDCNEMIHSCHGKNADKPSVCSGRGTCLLQDICICNENWFGEQCDITQCFGIFANDSSVCNGHGNCTDSNQCVCEKGWESNECNIPTCYGKKATEKSVCSGRGTCIGIDHCKCNPKYFGNECTKDRVITVYVATASLCSWSWMCLLILLFVFV